MAKRISGAPGKQYQVPDAELTRDERALVEWSTVDAQPPARRSSVKRGAAAAEHGRAALEAALGSSEAAEKAMGGRPSLEPAARKGQHSPVRQVRLPMSLNDLLTEQAAAEGRRPSEIIRDALVAYLKAHRAS